MNLYKEYLQEEERFLKNLERNLQDQINRLKVEELTVLKLISNTAADARTADGHQDEDTEMNDKENSSDDDDIILSSIVKKEQARRLQEQAGSSSNDLNVNNLPLNLDLSYEQNSTICNSIQEHNNKSENESENENESSENDTNDKEIG